MIRRFGRNIFAVKSVYMITQRVNDNLVNDKDNRMIHYSFRKKI